MLITVYNLLIRLILGRKISLDALSSLLALYPLRTALDVRCHFAAPWVIDHGAVQRGIAPYHILASGQAAVVLDGAPPIALHAGDVVVFLHGAGHKLLTENAAQAAPQFVSYDDHAIAVRSNSGAGPISDVLCGQFEFDQAAGEVLLRALPDMILVRTAGRADFAGLGNLIAMLRAESETLRPGAAAVLAQLSSALFALVMRAWLEQTDKPPGLFALMAERRLQLLLQAVLAAPGQDWTLETMAQRSHMSRATFVRLFTRVAGATPAAVLLQIRMAQATRLLQQGARSTGDIGADVGYRSEAAFNRVFKRHVGVTPGSLRRASREA